MGQRIIISEEERKDIQSLYEAIEGVQKGNIIYKNKDGKEFEFSVNHPIIGRLKVKEFDTNTWNYVFSPSWTQVTTIKLSGKGGLNDNDEIVGNVERQKRSEIINNMELGKNFIMNTNQGSLNFKIV